MEIDHHWCTSIYAPTNGTLVEWCTTTAAFSDADRRAARELADRARSPPDASVGPKSQKFHTGDARAGCDLSAATKR